ncbi:hypothetical protein [Streptacidiphilus sp. MAP12-33]
MAIRPSAGSASASLTSGTRSAHVAVLADASAAPVATASADSTADSNGWW